jgi:hypothetical protein
VLDSFAILCSYGEFREYVGGKIEIQENLKYLLCPVESIERSE